MSVRSIVPPKFNDIPPRALELTPEVESLNGASRSKLYSRDSQRSRNDRREGSAAVAPRSPAEDKGARGEPGQLSVAKCMHNNGRKSIDTIQRPELRGIFASWLVKQHWQSVTQDSGGVSSGSDLELIVTHRVVTRD